LLRLNARYFDILSLVNDKVFSEILYFLPNKSNWHWMRLMPQRAPGKNFDLGPIEYFIENSRPLPLFRQLFFTRRKVWSVKQTNILGLSFSRAAWRSRTDHSTAFPVADGVQEIGADMGRIIHVGRM
jgi:hypothetical protein